MKDHNGREIISPLDCMNAAQSLLKSKDYKPRLFEVYSKDSSHKWTIYADGTIDGFPHDVWIINHALPMFHMLIGIIHRLEANQAKECECSRIAQRVGL